MIGAVPVSLRAPGDTTQANYVSMMLVRWPRTSPTR